ncbi:MAG: ABC transporter permease [Treponema sp.]|jgi:peptide/nickel transport system permease protein|nr:ABC transporter permease [Treponema sp.]
MKKYIVQRLLSVLPVLLIVSVVIFSLTYFIPGDPAALLLGDNATAEDIAALRERLGLDIPPVPRYFNWIINMFRGDFGISVSRNTPVARMISSHLGPTLSLSVYSMCIACIAALPLGMLAARKKGTPADQGVSVLALLGISLPSFLLGLFLLVTFAVKLRWFPVAGYKPLSAGFGAHIRSLTLPAVALGFMYAALLMRMTRASLLETLSSDYVRMAKAKGVGEFSLVGKHALRNALVPVLTTLGQSFIGALSGATVVESMFGVPGIGALVVSSIGKRDFQVVQGVVLLIALINVVISLIVDLLYGLADPRVRLSADA